MVSIARKNLLSEKTRLIVSVGGVAFSILLITFLLGINNAFNRLLIDYVESWDADLVVAQEGVTDMSHTFSLLSEDKMNQVERLSGGKVYKLINRTTNVNVREEDGNKIINYPGRPKVDNEKGKKDTVSLIGFDTQSGVGKPQLILSGSPTPKGKEIIVDRVFANSNKLSLGDQIEMFDEIFTITGITDKNNMMLFSRAFIDANEAQETLKQKGRTNFILVSLPDPSTSEEIIRKLEEKISGITVFTRSGFAKSNAEALTETFVPIILVITIIGFITGTAVVGLMVYTATMEKIKEYGALKAIGVSNRRLFFIVFEQSLWSSILGYIVGIVLAWIVARLVIDVINLVVVFNREIYFQSFSAAILMSFIGSLIPIRKIAHADSAMVFRS